MEASTRPVPVEGVKNYYDQLFHDGATASSADGGVRLAAGTDADTAATVSAVYERSEGAPTGGEIRQVSTQDTRFGAPASTDGTAMPVRHREDFGHAVRRDTGTHHADYAPQAARSMRPSAAAPNVPIIPAAAVLTADDGPAHRLAVAHTNNPAAIETVWERIGEITVGRECRCELVLRNAGSGASGALTVEAFFPPSVQLTNADPPPEANGDRLTWSVKSLAPGAEQRIAVMMIPTQGGDLPLSAVVRTEETVATTLTVREPMLQVAVNGPEQVTIGETMTQSIVVSNPGTGTTDEVVVEVTLPQGLEHGKGRKISIPIGALAASQSQSIPLTLFAISGGPQQIQVRAAAGPNLVQEAAANVLVAAPTLTVAAEGPSLRFIGRDAAYRIVVTNDGAAAANNVRVSQVVPRGFDFIAATKGGQFESSRREVVWYVGRVEAGQSVELAATMTASGLGDQKHLVTVTSDGGARSQATIDTKVDGAASLVVEVLDLDDPIELESETAYEVRVRNEGTKPASNVEVVCQVPNGVETVAARGPTTHGSQGSLLTFQPISELEPGTTALYRIVVRGTQAGKHRFRVRLTSDSIDEPLVTEELTHYYAD